MIYGYLFFKFLNFIAQKHEFIRSWSAKINFCLFIYNPKREYNIGEFSLL